MNFSFFRKRPVTAAIEFSESEVRLAAWSRGEDGRFRLVAKDSAVISTPKEAEGSVRSFLSQFDLGRLTLVWSLPRPWATVRLLVPLGADSEAKDRAVEEALSALPFPITELSWEAKPLGVPGSSVSSRILLVVILKDCLSPFTEVFRNIGFWPETFSLGCFGLAGLAQGMSERTGYLHVHRCDGWVELDLWVEGCLMITRAFPLNDTLDASQRIAAECRATLESLSGFPAVERVLSSGLSDVERTSLGAELALPVMALECADLPDSRWGAILGSVWISPAQSLDLWPEEEKIIQWEEKFRGEFKRASLRAAILMMVLFLCAGWKACRKRRELVVLHGEIGRIERDARKASHLLERAEQMRAQQLGARAPLEILREIGRLAAPDISLSSLSYDTQGRVALQGTASRLSDVMGFIGELNRSRWFSGVELAGSQARNTPQETLVDFEINCPPRERKDNENAAGS